jgi:asparagine synthase (glutamine-hydrolysing)
MCGIAGIILKQGADPELTKNIAAMSHALRHRGPDGEGFITATENSVTACYKGFNNYKRTDLPFIPVTELGRNPQNNQLAFAHRRLSIVDLSDAGHQPMCDLSERYWIIHNGEIYNYVELREELEKLGHVFFSETDTEVVLKAYISWGNDCVNHFNGMWAFCIYNTEKQICFMSRDRLGVKPFYYINNTQHFAFASEQKAFISAGLLPAKINEKALHNYLINDLLESERGNFFEGIQELWPGCNLSFDLKTQTLSNTTYFHLNDINNLSNNKLSESELIDKISHTLENAVKLRMRSDVEIGVCLSGGIDSSALAVIIAANRTTALPCFTSVFRDQPFNEENFAGSVVKTIGAKHFKIEPGLEGFQRELDELVYSQDIPIWDSSTYAQYKVMSLAALNGVKVVLDGQGADELFGGYHHHYVTRWNNLFSTGKYLLTLRDMAASKKTFSSPFVFYLKERLKNLHNFRIRHQEQFFNKTFIEHHQVLNPNPLFTDLNSLLINDIYVSRLKSFLKCEDRCGMWHSVESRTPFSDDIELISLLFSFDANRKIKNGISKYLLREAVKDKLPSEIYTRYDKKGFETPMQTWMQTLRPQMIDAIIDAKFDFVNYNLLKSTVPTNIYQNKILFKLFILSRWKKLFSAT